MRPIDEDGSLKGEEGGEEGDKLVVRNVEFDFRLDDDFAIKDDDDDVNEPPFNRGLRPGPG